MLTDARTFFAVDPRETRLADAVVASHAVRAHGSVLAGLLCTLVPVYTQTGSALKSVKDDKRLRRHGGGLTNIDSPEDILEGNAQS